MILLMPATYGSIITSVSNSAYTFFYPNRSFFYPVGLQQGPFSTLGYKTDVKNVCLTYLLPRLWFPLSQPDT